MAKLAFVTGAAGFVGSYTSRALAEAGWDVVGIGLGGADNAALLRAHGIARWEETRLSLEALCRLARETGTPEAVIHCAGSGSVPYSLHNPYEDFLGNVNTTLDVLEFCRRQAPEARIVVPSSAAVYGIVDQMPIAETCPRHPISPYGTHKMTAEALCRSYAGNWGLSVSVIRLFSIYGAGLRKQLLWDACCKARDNAFSFFGSGDEIRDWLHVRDAARLITAALAFAAPDCPIVNGGTGIGTTIRDVVSRIGKLWTPRRTPVFSGKVKPGDPAHYVADCTRLSGLGFTPRIALDEGLAAYVAWFQHCKDGHA